MHKQLKLLALNSWPLTPCEVTFADALIKKIDHTCTGLLKTAAAAGGGRKPNTKSKMWQNEAVWASGGMDVLFKLSSACNSLENLWGGFCPEPPPSLSISISLSLPPSLSIHFRLVLPPLPLSHTLTASQPVLQWIRRRAVARLLFSAANRFICWNTADEIYPVICAPGSLSLVVFCLPISYSFDPADVLRADASVLFARPLLSRKKVVSKRRAVWYSRLYRTQKATR